MSDTAETETDTNTNTDEPTKAELHDRVRKLESTVEKLMPSRRDALKLGAAGITGAAGLSATSQSADASTGSAGTIGSSSDRPDVFADTVDANQLTGVSAGGDRQGCRVFLSSDQSISGGARPKIQFDSIEYDSDNNFDTSTHNWTCPKNGIYAVNLHVRFNGGGSGDTRQVIIGSGGNDIPSGEGIFNLHGDSDNADRYHASTINKYQSGDTIAGYTGNANSADTLKAGNASVNTFLEVAFLGGL